MPWTEKEREKIDAIAEAVIRIDERTKAAGERMDKFEKDRVEWREGVEEKVDAIRASVEKCQTACAMGAGGGNGSALAILFGKLDKGAIVKLLLALAAIIVLGGAGGNGLQALLKIIFGL